MDFQFYIVDVFTEHSCEGNPLAVIIGSEFPSTKRMQEIAFEMNFSETVFIINKINSNQAYPIKIFTPSREIEFTGHPLLGAAWVILNKSSSENEHLYLDTAIGKILITRDRKKPNLLWFRAPKIEIREAINSVTSLPGLENLDCEIDKKLPIQIASAGTSAILVPIKKLAVLENIKFDKDLFSDFDNFKLPKLIYFFCFETYKKSNDICVRFFFDADGLREDIATGNGAAFLAKYLKDNLIFSESDFSFAIEQGHNLKRPSIIFVKGKMLDGFDVIDIGGHVSPTISDGKILI